MPNSGTAQSPLNNNTVGWVSDAPGRGTLSIIESCLLTIGLCIWSALHLNIPPERQTVVKFWLQGVKWMLLGLLGPELVVWAAWKQFISARTLQDKMRELNGSRHTLTDGDTGNGKNGLGNEAKSQSDWTLVHSFYAGMGGFVFDLDDNSAFKSNLSKPGPERFTVTPRGIALLAECRLLPSISRAAIEDKSKADGLAKAFVCLQAGWMLIQVVGRIGYRLPVTLLEVNTIGHVICAFAIYMLWWHKPRLINEPTQIKSEGMEAVFAYMWMSSGLSDADRTAEFSILGPKSVPELSNLAFYPCSLASSNPVFLGPEVSQQALQVDESKTCPKEAEPVTDLRDVWPMPASRFVYTDHVGWLGPSTSRHSPKKVITPAIGPTQNILRLRERNPPPIRWQLALDAIYMFPAIRNRFEVKTGEGHDGCLRLDPFIEELLCHRAGNWPSEAMMSAPKIRGLLIGMALWSASLAFGGVHAAAWNEHFPSLLECWLWRSCSVYIMASGLLWLAINCFAQLSRRFDRYWEKVLAGHASRLSYGIIGACCTICGLIYGFARLFLVIEAVISLRSLPVGAYETPDWSQIIPHL